MQPLALTASTVVSAMGRGSAASLAALQARRSGLRAAAAGEMGFVGEVGGLDDVTLPDELARFDCRNNRLAALALATDGFAAAVADAVAFYGADRIALVIGTSTSGVRSAEAAFRRRDGEGRLPADFCFAGTQDLFSAGAFVRAALGLRGPAMVVSVACASSARSFADAQQLIAAGVCDAAVVGGVDTLCGMTLHGFAALQLIAAGACRPCDARRDGISIGEAGGFALLERPGARPRVAAQAVLLGYGATSDGYHMSSPHPAGEGAIGAMRAALGCAGLAPAAIDYINLHGTGTPANDAMEDIAVSTVFGTATPCSSTKGFSGHTLGASGILEAVLAVQCIGAGLMPGCLGVDALDPAFTACVLTENRAAPVRRVMSNSFGFGGINCSLVFGAPDLMEAA